MITSLLYTRRDSYTVDYRITFRNAIATSTDDWRARDRIFASECDVSVKEKQRIKRGGRNLGRHRVTTEQPEILSGGKTFFFISFVTCRMNCFLLFYVRYNCFGYHYNLTISTFYRATFTFITLPLRIVLVSVRQVIF